jgi:hypothetical protein
MSAASLQGAASEEDPDEEPFQDFSQASPWERLVAACEETLTAWVAAGPVGLAGDTTRHVHFRALTRNRRVCMRARLGAGDTVMDTTHSYTRSFLRPTALARQQRPARG